MHGSNTRRLALACSVFVATYVAPQSGPAQSAPAGTTSAATDSGNAPVKKGTKKKQLGSSLAGGNTHIVNRPRTSVTRTADQVEFARRSGVSKWEYRDAYLYWLRQRAYPFDNIEPSTYRLGVQHRFGMPRDFSATAAVTKWEFVGPRNLPPPYRQYFGQGITSGRINGVAFDLLDPNIVYLATAGGGLWKVNRQSKKWISLSDNWATLRRAASP